MQIDWESLLDGAVEQMRGWYDAFDDESRASGLSSLLSPVDPFNRSAILTPVVAAAAVVSLIVLSGAAIAAAAVTISALLAVSYVLSEIFGYEVSLAVPPHATA